MGEFLFFVFVVVVVIGFLALRAYNELQRSAQDIKEALSNTSIATVKKINLINQLMDVVKNYQEGEQLVHLSVSRDTGVQAIHSSHQNSNLMMTSLLGMADRYPELKADQQYHRLVSNIEMCEKDIGQARNHYNRCVKKYNVFRTTIPTIFIANAMGFPDAPYLDLSIENAENVLLKEFKTDDGERLNAFLKNTTQNLADGSKKVIDKATEASKKIANSESAQQLTQKVQDLVKHKELTFFYVLPDTPPKGPVDSEKLLELANNDVWVKTVAISEVGKDDWLGFDTWKQMYLTQSENERDTVMDDKAPNLSSSDGVIKETDVKSGS